MFVTKWYHSDFKVAYSNKNTLSAVNLDEGVITTYKKDSDGDYAEFHKEAIRLKDGNIQVWLIKQQAWGPVNKKLSRAYSDFMADKEILGSDDDS